MTTPQAYPWFPPGDDCAYCDSLAEWFVIDVYYEKKIGAHACSLHITNALNDASTAGVKMDSTGVTVFKFPECKAWIATA